MCANANRTPCSHIHVRHGTNLAPRGSFPVETPGRIPMKAFIAGAALCAFVLPALAADEYYVVQDATTKKCTIVDKKPTTTTTTIVGDGKVFKTRTEAEAGMKTIKICSTN
jgi:hypothetical protein